MRMLLSPNVRQLKYLSDSGTWGLRKESEKLCFRTKEVMQGLIPAVLQMVQYSVWVVRGPCSGMSEIDGPVNSHE